MANSRSEDPTSPDGQERPAGRVWEPRQDEPQEATRRSHTVLVIEDDEHIGRRLTHALDAAGYRSTWVRTGRAGLTHAAAAPPDVVLLDLGLPDLDGVEIASTLRRQQPALLLVMLTARTDDMDVIIGLDAGADDYLAKPFSLTVLLARLRAHLRSRPSTDADGPLQAGTLTVDPATRRVLVGALEIELRPKEFDLLTALTAQAGRAVTRETLMATVWDENWFGSTKTLDVTMASLRQRLQDSAHLTGMTAPTITTLRGHGYRLELEPDKPEP